MMSRQRGFDVVVYLSWIITIHRTALHLAASGGYVECVKILLAHGADAAMTTTAGWTAAHFAAETGRYGIVWYGVAW